MKKNITFFTIIVGIMSGVFAAIYFGKELHILRNVEKIHTAIVERMVEAVPTEMPDFCIKAPVLFYHHIQPHDMAEQKNSKSLSVAPEIFESQIVYLKKKGYTLTPLETLVESLLHRKDPGKIAMIVMDDGYEDNFIYAFPIAKRQKVHLNVAFSTGLASKYDMLSWGEVKQMATSGYISFYNHSWSHQSLHGNDERNIEQQVLVAQNQLEKNLDKLTKTYKILIYPYGRTGEMVQNVLKQHDFEAAFTDQKGMEHCLSRRYALPRLRTGNFNLTVHGL